MNVSFYDPFLKQLSFVEGIYNNVDFDQLCQSSDFIVLACSLNKKVKILLILNQYQR